MAIDLNKPEAELFRRMIQALHNRRYGRDGTNRWSKSLLRRKVERPGLDLLHDYAIGDPPLRSDIHSQWKPYVRAFLRAGRYNIAGKTVTATSNRMSLLGFRTAAADDEIGDQVARSIMLANEYDLRGAEVHDWMLELGDGYTITTPPGPRERWAKITAEDPREVITLEDPVTGETVAGLKLFRDEWDARDMAYFAMRMPGGEVMATRLVKPGLTTIRDAPFRFPEKEWELDDREGAIDPVIRVPYDVMPFDRFQNRYGIGEFERHLDTLDRINDKVFNEWWITKIQAFRQRAVRGLPDTQKVRNTETGRIEEKEIDYADMFTASPDEMWRVPADVDFWESTAVDLTPITAGTQKDIERYAAAVDLPLHTVTPDAANGSAEGATLMREEHVFKIDDRKRRVTRRHASVMSKAFLFSGEETRADVTQIDPIWGPSERYSLEQKADAASKLKGIYSVEAILTDIMQVPPADMPRHRDLMAQELIRMAMQAAIAAPPPVAAGPTPPALNAPQQ